MAAHLEAVVQQLPTAMVIAEAPSGRVLLCNDRVATIWRRSLEPAEEIADYGRWEGFHADGRPYQAEEWPLARSVTTGQAVEEEEIEIVRGDGSRGVIRVSSTPIRDETGEVVMAVATFGDITAQRRQETARRFLSEASAVLVSSLDYPTTLRNVARLAVPTLADWCAVDILDETGGIERLALEHVDSHKAALAREVSRRYPSDPNAAHGVARVLRTGDPELFSTITDSLLRTVARDEEHLRNLRELGMGSAMVVPLTARGKILGALTFVLAQSSGRRYDREDLALAGDLAVRAGQAIDNARLYDESRAANRAKADFLAVMSHELRTPLTAIIGYAELLELGIPEPVTERQREQIERIELAARHLQQLIEEILTVASLEAGEAKVRRQEIGLDELVHRAEVIARPMALAKDLDLEVAAVEAVTLETDPDKLLQVLLNLLSNAVKFTDRGSIRVSARVKGDSVEIAVRDTGVGVDARHQERIFDPFWQVEQPITRRAGGTGLGLTITRGLMDLLGGEIRVHSEPGQGSTFTARIPLRPQE